MAIFASWLSPSASLALPLIFPSSLCCTSAKTTLSFNFYPALAAILLEEALNIPAAYTFGYLPDIGVPPPWTPMDFCAWMEVYLGGRWWTFDPRNNTPRLGRILIGRGRDALDVAMVTSFGQLELESMVVWADEVIP